MIIRMYQFRVASALTLSDMHAGNKDGSVKQPLLILNEDNGQQLYKGNTSHWKVWQSLIEEGDQLDDRDDVFR